ncbi:MAG: class I SAM-dependent methyltransferase [Candidatus Electrothrix scaldis]|nr:MAG: class I SAM-dependent methyltransferase [Candidatus Electrothrix sp. GW3-3]
MNRQGIWDFWAKFYDRLWLQGGSLQPTRALVCQKIAEYAKQTGGEEEERKFHILDMGCGTGQLYGDLVQTLGKERLQYLGIDPSGAMLERALDKFPQAAFFQSDVMEVLPDKDLFDLIVCSHSFPYYSDGEAALKRLATLLKPGGQLLLTQACTDSLYDAIILKLTGFTTSKAIYRSSQEMKELGSTLFRELQTARISEKVMVPSLWLFQWVKG